jgi:hypothetical protein
LNSSRKKSQGERKRQRRGWVGGRSEDDRAPDYARLRWLWLDEYLQIPELHKSFHFAEFCLRTDPSFTFHPRSNGHLRRLTDTQKERKSEIEREREKERKKEREREREREKKRQRERERET